ncbi:MAG: hypothetical protein LBT86_03490 [Deltaproteobacteria bacterium]|nr:hypothetical protein [Deltaproteobacteria bacterium]
MRRRSDGRMIVLIRPSGRSLAPSPALDFLKNHAIMAHFSQEKMGHRDWLLSIFDHLHGRSSRREAQSGSSPTDSSLASGRALAHPSVTRVTRVTFGYKTNYHIPKPLNPL